MILGILGKGRELVEKRGRWWREGEVVEGGARGGGGGEVGMAKLS